MTFRLRAMEKVGPVTQVCDSKRQTDQVRRWANNTWGRSLVDKQQD